MSKKNKIAFGKLNLLRNDKLESNKIRIGFVGGGPNSFIGYTHRLSARFDNRFEFLAGVFSRDKKKSVKFGESLGIDKERCYNDFKEMAEKGLVYGYIRDWGSQNKDFAQPFHDEWVQVSHHAEVHI